MCGYIGSASGPPPGARSMVAVMSQEAHRTMSDAVRIALTVLAAGLLVSLLIGLLVGWLIGDLGRGLGAAWRSG
jgi:hypothetical protein